MFSNQAIKSFKKQLVSSNHSIGFENMKLITDNIPQAQKYYMGSDKMIRTIQSIGSKCKDQVFMGSAAHDVKLPFDICWFDFIDNEFFSHFDKELEGISLKVGMFVVKVNIDSPKTYPDIIQITPAFSYGPTKSWVLCGESIFIKVGEFFNVAEMKELHRNLFKNTPKENEFPSFIRTGINTNMLTMPNINFNDREYSKSWATLGRKISELSAATLNVFLMILNCQNVITEVKSTIKKQKKKTSKHKSRGVTYKVLKFKLPKSSKLYKDKKQTDNITTMPLHLCSGHFKTYTEDRPLFGKVVGRWWWNNYMRGSKEYGEVKKDYHAQYA